MDLVMDKANTFLPSKEIETSKGNLYTGEYYKRRIQYKNKIL